MLTLWRREGDTIVIDDGRVRITVLKVQGGGVKIGVEAPDDVEINRGELQALIDVERSLIHRK